jgi:hypothetical protein
LLENHSPLDLFQTVIASVSAVPGSPRSVNRHLQRRVAVDGDDFERVGDALSVCLVVNVAVPWRDGRQRRQRSGSDQRRQVSRSLDTLRSCLLPWWKATELT